MQFFPFARHPQSAPVAGIAGDSCHHGAVQRLLGWVLVGLFLMISQAGAATARISWNANTEADLAAYVVHYGTSRGNYTNTAHAGLATSLRIPGLADNRFYYFVVVAYNQSGQRSQPSAEVSYRTPATSSPAPQGRIVSPARDLTLIPGQEAYFSGAATDPNGDNRLEYVWTFGDGSGVPSTTGAVPGQIEFNIPGTYEVKLEVTNSKGFKDPTPATIKVTVEEPPVKVVPRSGWTVKYVNSEEPDYAAALSIDGDPNTMWHTRWRSPDKQPPPHEIQIGIGAQRRLTGFRYVPRQDNFTVGNIGRYQFYVSMDGNNWGSPVATGRFGAGSQEKEVFFAPKVGKFVRLVSLSEVNGYNDCSMAELNLLQSQPQNKTPVAYKQTLVRRNYQRFVITLKGTDADGDSLRYQILRRPKNGQLGGSGPKVTYLPNRGFVGTDTFTYRVTDGFKPSRPVTVSIRVKKSLPNSKPSNPTTAGSNGDSGTGAATALRFTRGSITLKGERYLTLTIQKPTSGKGKSEPIPLVQVSPNLVRWYSGKNHTTILANNERILRVRDNIPFSPGRKRFIRLKP